MKPVDEAPISSVSTEQQSEPVTRESTITESDSLMAEVESFLSKRDELAQKFAEEIEATELKLAELKKTAASLFPENAGSGAASQKAKKPKPKPAAKAEAASSSETPSPVESA